MVKILFGLLSLVALIMAGILFYSHFDPIFLDTKGEVVVVIVLIAALVALFLVSVHLIRASRGARNRHG